MTIAGSNEPTVVLLVDDESLVRMFAAETLREEAGFKVIEANNAEEALRVLEATSHVQALVTDVEMPGSLDGFTLARVVHRAWPHIGIVIVSGRMTPGISDMPPGARFLAKPYAPEDLIELVQSVLQEGPGTIPGSPSAVLPQAIKVHQPHTGIGVAASLAQPLPKPDE